MVFCCLDSFTGPSDPSSSSPTIVVYPGQRRNQPTAYYKTAGNALSATPPPVVGGSVGSLPYIQLEKQKQQQDLVAVTVPPGVRHGQTIRILNPDGNGQQIEATVPAGMTTGATFYVRSTASAASETPTVSTSNNVDNHRLHQYMPPTVAASVFPVPSSTSHSNIDVHEPWAVAHPIGDYSDLTPLPVPTAPVEQTSANAVATTPVAAAMPNSPQPFSQCLDEPLTRDFHARRQQHQQSLPREDEEYQTSNPYHHGSNAAPSTISQQQSRISQQRLVLVRVPPGTAPGTTLHVRVPDEPGRLLAAQVPPGNVREFHVAYEPQSAAASHHHGLALSPYTTMQQQQQQQQQSYHSPARRPNNNNNINSNRTNGSNNDGDWFLPAAGGFATGLASMMVFDHFAHGN